MSLVALCVTVREIRFTAGVRGVNEMYLEFKAAKAAVVGVMPTPRLTCQFRDIVTSSYRHVTTDHLRRRFKNKTESTKRNTRGEIISESSVRENKNKYKNKNGAVKKGATRTRRVCES